jgi:hypothetical protein
MDVRETFTPVKLAANASYTLKNARMIGGFLATATGTLKLDDPAGNEVIAATAVTAGVFTPLPCKFAGPGAKVTLASSAAGTLFIA